MLQFLSESLEAGSISGIVFQLGQKSFHGLYLLLGLQSFELSFLKLIDSLDRSLQLFFVPESPERDFRTRFFLTICRVYRER